MKPILVVKTGTTLPEIRARRGDFEDWIRTGLAAPEGAVCVAAVCDGAPLPRPSSLAGVVVTGSSAMVTEQRDWSVRTAAWLRGVVVEAVPVLGICYGHQLLADALGGRVGPNPSGREVGTVEVRLEATGDALLGGLPEREKFQATHVEAVLRLPPGARWLASTSLDRYHAFAVGSCAWGVQFHPEFDLDVMRGYLAGRAEVLRSEGLDPIALSEAAVETPAGAAVLRRFASLSSGA